MRWILLVLLLTGCALVQKGCPEDAKICPDGTTVGRTWLTCEFAACPEADDEMNKELPNTPDGASSVDAQEGPVACPADAKLCPDGSAVGRFGPDCEFAECPETTPEIPADPTRSCTSNRDCVAVKADCCANHNCMFDVVNVDHAEDWEAQLDCAGVGCALSECMIRNYPYCDGGTCKLDQVDPYEFYETLENDATICEARTEDCQEEDSPVCASDAKTYASGCEACAAKGVSWYIPKACGPECGNGICETWEDRCIPSECDGDTCTDDCGSIYCPQDCELG